MQLPDSQSGSALARSIGVAGFSAALLVGATSVLVHEVAHALPQYALGYTEIGPLHFDGLDQGFAPDDRKPWYPALISASGPTLPLVLAALGALLVYWGRWLPVGLALAVAGVVEPTVELLPGGYSEFSGWARVIGWPDGRPVVAVLSVAIAYALVTGAVYVMWRRKTDRPWLRLGMAVLGVVSGFALWLLVIGPVVLP